MSRTYLIESFFKKIFCQQKIFFPHINEFLLMRLQLEYEMKSIDICW